MKWNVVDWIAWALLILGGLNWGLVGFFHWDLVAAIFGGDDAVVSRIVYAIVGLAGLWQLFSVVSKQTS